MTVAQISHAACTTAGSSIGEKGFAMKIVTSEKVTTASARVYILLDIVRGKSVEVIQSLRNRPGVVIADILEGAPDVLLMLEALNRQELTKLTVETMASVENMTENICLLPVQNQVGVVDVKMRFDRRKYRRGN